MKNLKFIVISGCLIYSLISTAQVTVKGTVKNDNNQEAAYAFVRLLHPDSTFVKGTLTDSIGNYRLSDVAAGDYLLSISSMGYVSQWHTFVVGSQDKELPLISFKKNSVMLGEVEVKGSSFIRQKDHVLIIPDKQQMKHATTGYDLLYNLMIPGIDVDRRNGSVTSLGRNVTLYIDGRKVDYREVQSLRPRDIEKVEYYDVPTGKYAGDAASVNYITKQWETGGYISLDADQTIGYLKGDYNAAAKIAHGSTSYSLFVGHTMHEYNENDNQNEEQFNFPNQSFVRMETISKDEHKNNRQYAQLNILDQKKGVD